MKNSISSIFENSHYDYKEIIISKNIETELMTIAKCQNCENHTNFSLNIDEKNKTSQKNANIKLKKFKNIEEQIDLKKINNDFGRCVCGMRHLDIAMAHVLKIMIEKNIPLRKHTLRDGPIPLLTLFTSNPNKHDYVGKDSLVILHPQLKTNVANIIVKEVDEVKGVLKGYPNDTVGIKDTDSKAITYELLAGSDIRCDIVKIPRNNFIEKTNNKIIENTNNKIIKNTSNKLIENTSKTSLKKET
ncbi:MAG: hypothetical protein FWE58_05840, partial [Methanobrevibacter sp.]|nr:hypothetical protein [Methanobrevibacter sp.]